MMPLKAFDAFAPIMFSAYCTFSSITNLMPWLNTITNASVMPYCLFSVKYDANHEPSGNSIKYFENSCDH